jgi:hypothetical protein
MDIGTRSLFFPDYLVADFGIYILFKNVYSMRMADLSICYRPTLIFPYFSLFFLTF